MLQHGEPVKTASRDGEKSCHDALLLDLSWLRLVVSASELIAEEHQQSGQGEPGVAALPGTGATSTLAVGLTARLRDRARKWARVEVGPAS